MILGSGRSRRAYTRVRRHLAELRQHARYSRSRSRLEPAPLATSTPSCVTVSLTETTTSHDLYRFYGPGRGDDPLFFLVGHTQHIVWSVPDVKDNVSDKSWGPSACRNPFLEQTQRRHMLDKDVERA